MKSFLYCLPSIIFNVIEAIIIYFVGALIKIPIHIIVLIIIVFTTVRMLTKSAKHYKDWYKCLLWSTLVFLSLFMVVKVGIIISLVMTIFSALILSGKGDIKDCFMWKRHNSKFSDIDSYIEKNYNVNSRLIEFENVLKRKDENAYLLYKYRFIDKKTFSEMSFLTNMDGRRITDKLNEIALSIRTFCDI